MNLCKKLLLLLLLLCSVSIKASCTFEYSVSESSGKKITEIVTTVAHTRALFLWGKERHLRKLGDEVRKDTIFFQFWAYVFSHPKLAKDMKTIKGSSMKYNSFISGGRPELLEEYNKDRECFLQAGKEFALFLKVDPEQTVSLLKTGLEALTTQKTGLKPFFDYLIAEKNK